MSNNSKSIYIIVLLCIFLYYPLFAKPDKSSKKDQINIKKVNKTNYSNKVSKDGYTYAYLIGNVQIEYDSKTIFADEMTVKFFNKKAVTLFAKGNILVKEEDKTVIAKSLFIYIPSKTFLLQGAYSVKNNMYIYGLSLSINHDQSSVFKHVQVSTSRYLNPHYSVQGSKIWVDKKKNTLLTNATLNIGQDTLLYFPVYYATSYGTGIITNMNYDYYLGTSINNTYLKEGDNYKEKFMFDYYQRLGEYVSNEYSRDDIGNLHTHMAFAYDKHVKYENGAFINYFEQVLGEGPSRGRSLRYHIDVDYSGDIVTPKEADGWKVGLKAHYMELSDPNFKSQFEDDRKDTFDMGGLLFPTTDSTSRAGSSSLTGVEGRAIEGGFSTDYHGYHFEFQNSFIYDLNPDFDASEKVNTFDSSYYKNSLEKMILPSIIFSKTFEVYKIDKKFANRASLTMPVSIVLSNSFSDTNNYEPKGLESKEVLNDINLNLLMPLQYNRSKFQFSIPFSLNNTVTYRDNATFLYNKTGNLDSLYDQVIYRGSLDYSPDMRFDFNRDANLSIGSSLSTNYSNQYQKTQNADEEQIKNDNNNNYYDINQTVGGNAKLSWKHNDNEYLQGSMEFAYNYNMAVHEGKSLSSEQAFNTSQNSYTMALDLLKTRFQVNTYDQKGSNVLKEYEKGPLDVSVDFESIPYLTISEGYSYDRYYKGNISNNVAFDLNIPTHLNLFSWFWFSNLDMNVSWNQDFQNKMLSYLTYKIQLDFNITNLWKFSFALNGRNSKLFLYGSKEKGFWNDLWQSIEFWDTQARQNSSFKMDDFSFKIWHDLDEWSLEAGIEFEPQLARTGSYYFQSEFYFTITLKDLSAFSAPSIQYISDDGSQY